MNPAVPHPAESALASGDTATAPTRGPRTFEPDPTLPGLSFFGVVRSELSKLLALRTTYWLSAITLGLSALISGGVAWGFSSFSDETSQLMLAEGAMTGLYFGLLLLGALAVISMTTEFTTGAIRSSLTVVPRRNLLYLAKATAITLLVAVVTAAVIIACHLVAALFSGELEVLAPFSDSEVGYVYLTHWISVIITALMGFGLGALLRSSAGGIVVLTIIIFVVQIVVAILYGVTQGAEWAEMLMRAEYSYLVMEFTSVDAVRDMELWQSLLGVFAWAAVPFGLGWLTFSRRDV